MTIISHHTSQTQQSDPFTLVYAHNFIQLTTYRKNGEGVPTPVGFTPHERRLYISTPGTAFKLKRLRQNTRVTLAPCTFNGKKILGESIEGQARILAPEERAIAERAFIRRYGMIYRVTLAVQNMRNKQRTYIEIQPIQGER